MKKLFTLLFASLFLLSNAQTINGNYVDGQIYLKFKNGTIKSLSKENPNNVPLSKLTVLQDLISTYGITKAYKPFYQADDDVKLQHIFKLDFTNFSLVENLIRDLKGIGIVEYAEKVPLVKTMATPNDPTVGPHLAQINANNAWNVFNSTANGNSNITVAIVDNAIDRAHPDLTANIWTNPGEIANNSIDDDNNGYVDDVNGWDCADNDNNTIPSNVAMNHGTHCAGIAGARTDNAVGIASIGWNIKIIPVKCQNNTGTTTGISAGYAGIIYAAKVKARVISCSWGGVSAASAAEQSVIDYAWNRGCIVICAAGNDGGTANETVLHYPAAYNNVFCVASVASNNVKSSFSCRGPWVDICAPGENIRSTTPSNGYQLMSGTSMATPLVAGLAGLMLSKCSYMTQTDVINCIKSTAANVYTIAANSTYSAGLQLGAGRIEAFAAMNCAAGFLNVPPIANFFSITRNVCPNTPVTFKDSSIYNPQTWSWSFPGGTPATSTSSNPSITYTAPGIYNVSMTVSNANGNSSKTRNGYITVAGPVNLPLIEGFQTLPFVPVNWTEYNLDNDSINWKRMIGVGGNTVNAAAACAMFNNYDEDATGFRDEMRTPKLNFSNTVNAKIKFDVAYVPFDNTQYTDTLELRLSTDCGQTWTSIYTKGGATLATMAGTMQASRFVPTAAQWRRDSINISVLASTQPNVMIGFVNHGHYGQAIYVDNINIATPTPTTSFNTLASGCAGTAYTFTNNTLGAAGYTWSASPAASIAAPNATNASITFTNAGTYTITLASINGTATSSATQTISISTNPTVNLTASSTSLCSGPTVTLTASGASTYSWNTGATSNVLNVTPNTTTSYSVTGYNGSCSQTKTITINVTTTPTVSVNNQTICAGGTATLSASGATTYTWNGSFVGNPNMVTPTVNTTYTVVGANGNCINTKTVSVTIGSSISINTVASTPTTCANGSVTVTASGATSYTWLPMNTNGSSITITPSVTTTYSIVGSNGSCNGNAIATVSVITAPVLNVTPSSNSVCTGGSVSLLATGYTTYTWVPGNLTGSVVSVAPSSSQVYTVTGNMGNCVGTKTTAISVVTIPTVNISGNNSICNGASTNLTANGATSYSWNTGASTNSLTVSPASNTTYTVTGFNSTCSGSAAVTVTVNPNPVLSVSSSSNPICIGDGANLTVSGATQYTWDSGSNTSVIYVTPTVSTTYTVIGQTGNCTSTITITQTVNACPTGIIQNNNFLSTLQIYPNPSNDFINIQADGLQFNYTIMDNLGRVIINQENVYSSSKINVGNIAKGVYYIEVRTNNESTRKKLIIE